MGMYFDELLSRPMPQEEMIATTTAVTPTLAPGMSAPPQPGSLDAMGVMNLLSKLGPQVLQSLTSGSNQLVRGTIPGWNKYGSLVTDIGIRGTATGLGTAIGAAGGPLGSIAGAAAGSVLGNYLNQGAQKANFGNTITPEQNNWNIASDTVFGGLPAMWGIAKTARPFIPESTYTRPIMDAFKRLNIPLHPMQIEKRYADAFQRGPINQSGQAALETWKQTQDDIIASAGQNILGKVGATAPDALKEAQLISEVGGDIARGYQAVGKPFQDAAKLIGKKKIAGDVLVSDLQSLSATLLKKGDAPSAKKVDQAINNYVTDVLAKSKGKLNWEQVQKIRGNLLSDLKNEFVDPATGKISQNWNTVKKGVTAITDKLEDSLAAEAAVKVKGGKVIGIDKAPIKAPAQLEAARRGYASYNTKIEELRKLGGNDIENIIRRAGRDQATNATEFADALLNNPDALLNTFLKSKNPAGTLKIMRGVAGPKVENLLRSQFGKRIFGISDESAQALLTGTNNIQGALKKVGINKTHADVLFGKQNTGEFFKDAQALSIVKQQTKGTPGQFGQQINKTLNPDAIRDTAHETASNVGRNTLGGSVGRGVSTGGAALIGGGLGYQQGNTPEERIANAAIGAGGAATGTLFLNPVVRALINTFGANKLSPLAYTSAQQAAQLGQKDIFGSYLGGILGSLGGIGARDAGAAIIEPSP